MVSATRTLATRGTAHNRLGRWPRSVLIGAVVVVAAGVPTVFAQGRAVDIGEDEATATSGAEAAVAETRTILFGFSESDPDASALQELDDIAALVAGDDALRVRIDAHTDNRGWSLGNIELSRLRARAVARALLMRGVSLARVSARAHGESSPIASNATAEGRRRNRRAEITLLR